ncbi:acyl-CoA dehydrogenase [Niabella ginsenosidivorans]|uniref:Acyl-CoA dehydrogenase n=1 Tax=Niabella ginsenosidivorans TaxID=1176587 RepID=A0A1A9I7E7_9BACT|nr:acyl-CoA dehydrogenase [Niabella ginsenosidivorans]ANH82969.1 acyl-CoA dehydrogenase [Niabella ginsenosidivorans]
MIRQEIKKPLETLAKLSDEQGVFLPGQLDIIYKEKWLKLFVPRSQNGLELTLIEGLEMEEALARIDGSLGWTVTLCAGASLFTGYLSPAVTGPVFRDPEVCFGGSGALSGTARETGEGYLVCGNWKYATGAPYCTHFTANCRIERNGKPVLNDKGAPLYRSFLFLREEVTLHKDWNTMGLKATASDSFSVSDLFVAKERSFMIDPLQTTLPGAVYQFPFLQFAEATLAVNTLGMAQHFLDELEKLLQYKTASGTLSTEQMSRIEQLRITACDDLSRLRQSFFAAVAEAWEHTLAGRPVPEHQLEQVSRFSRGLARASRAQVVQLYPYCGVAATQNDTTINRIFRDIFTASQHLLLNL